MNKRNIIAIILLGIIFYLIYRDNKISANKKYHKDIDNYCKDDKNCGNCIYYTECYSIYE